MEPEDSVRAIERTQSIREHWKEWCTVEAVAIGFYFEEFQVMMRDRTHRWHGYERNQKQIL